MRGPSRELPQPELKAVSSTCDEINGGGSNWRGFFTNCTSAPGRRAPHNGSGSSSGSPPRGAPAAEPHTVGDILRSAKVVLQPTLPVERQFYADCYRACQVTPPTSTSPPPPPYLSSVPEVALRLSCLGHRVVLRRVTDSRHYWSRSMNNVFCYCVLPGTGIGYVLDPGFKEAFKAGRMSDRYRDIWECLPPLFVGPPAKLVQLVQMLCSELAASFQAADWSLPPWRTFNCTISRWMSPVFRDLPVPMRRPMQPAAAAAAGGSGAGLIPAAEARAFLRACNELLAGTASGRPRGATGVVAAPWAAAAHAGGGGGGAARGMAAAASVVEGGDAAVAAIAVAEVPAAGRTALAEAGAPCSCSAGRPTAQVGDDGGGAAAAAVAAGQVKVPYGAAPVCTAATAATSSAARGPPQLSGREPLRVIIGFEIPRAPNATQ